MPEPPFPVDRCALLTTHFGDPRWVELLLRRVRTVFPELPDARVFVIDQDRTARSAELLRRRLGPVCILHFPRSEAHVAVTGHDHAHVLNLAAREIGEEYLLLFDSDAHPVSDTARPRLAALIATRDAVLAANGLHDSRSHPCFMLFGPAVDRDGLQFDAGQLEVGTDTGREIYAQVRELGCSAELLRPEAAFDGRWGDFYLDGAIYHHRSGSFPSNPDPRIATQVATWRREEWIYRRRVFRGEYALSWSDRRFVGVLSLWRRATRRARAALGRLRPDRRR